jgi:murein hydrolase activator
MRFVSTRVAALLALGAMLAYGTLAGAQSSEQRLREQREELERIRRERDELTRRQSELQGRVHNLSEEVSNLHRQAEATSRLVKSLDQQLNTITAEVAATSTNLERAQSELGGRRGALRQRLVDIYKRGPLYTVEALLSAKSFGELVARYKYLHELTLRDRTLVTRVEGLYNEISSQRALLVRLQNEFERNREEKAHEEARLRSLERERQRSLVATQQTAKQVQDRLTRIARDEARVGQLIASLEATRRRTEAAAPNGPSATASSLKTSDFGKLDWPVDGSILYRFGRAVNPNNTMIRWNGVGIGAAMGTPVRSVAAGEVMVADNIGTYGMTVIIQHGGGDYSVYGSLARADVKKGAQVTKGQAIGTVGRGDPDMEPHLHFEIRPKGRATDPLAWLQQKRD